MTLPVFSPPIWGLVFAISAAVILWLISLRIRDASIVDICWGPGVAGVVDLAAWLGQAGGPRTSAVLLLVNLWAIRLAAHIWARHKGEDHRYAAMRTKFGSNWWWASLLQVFLLQAILIWFIPAPLVAAVLYSHVAMGWLDYLGIALAASALVLEALADFQLAAFRADPANKGRVCDVGLWRWSRHPNYFFEWFGWLAYPAIAISLDYGWGWATLLAPVFMYWILVHVTGIPPLEAQMLRSRGERYRDYQSRTSMFFPLPPQKGSVA